MIDAQLTTEIFGLLAPGAPHVALDIAHYPIRTAGYGDAVLVSEFYVIMHALAAMEPRGQLSRNVLTASPSPLGSICQMTLCQRLCSIL